MRHGLVQHHGRGRRAALVAFLAATLASCAGEPPTALPPPPAADPPAAEATAAPPPAHAVTLDPQGLIRPALREAALAAFARYRGLLARHDRIAVIDYAKPSTVPRLYILDLATGAVTAHLTAHGRGSDPDHDGLMEWASDAPGSGASPVGAFKTADIYCGVNGKSLRLEGLEATNGNALRRGIVLHATYLPGRTAYMSRGHIAARGRPGRSCGCFVVLPEVLRMVAEELEGGRLVYAASDRPLPETPLPYPSECADLQREPDAPPPDQSPGLCAWPGEPQPPAPQRPAPEPVPEPAPQPVREPAPPDQPPLRGTVGAP